MLRTFISIALIIELSGCIAQIVLLASGARESLFARRWLTVFCLYLVGRILLIAAVIRRGPQGFSHEIAILYCVGSWMVTLSIMVCVWMSYKIRK